MESIEPQNKIKQLGEAMMRAGFPGKSIVVALVGAVAIAGGATGLMETNEAGYITMKQSILTGNVSVIAKPGLFCQCFGSITTYREAGMVQFAKQDSPPTAGKLTSRPSKEKEQGSTFASEIEVRFNDGGLGWISVMALFDLPQHAEKLNLIHNKFTNYENLIEIGIKPAIEESIALTAALMNSSESYTTKRAIFSEWAMDQLSKGTYITEETVHNESNIAISESVEANVVKVKLSDDGAKLRNENPLERYGIDFKQFQITHIRYEAETEKLITTKRDALQQTVVAKIAAERAKQERLAAEEFGKKKVKIAEYEAMVKKKTAEVEAEEAKAVALIVAERKLEVAKVTKQQETNAANKKVELTKLEKEKEVLAAEKAREVAAINLQAAKLNKDTNILDGEGLGKKRQLIYEADGALQQKLDAYVEVMTVLAKELGKQKWVPDITMSGAQGSGAGGATDANAAAGFMNLWMMKTAKDLGVELVADKR